MPGERKIKIIDKTQLKSIELRRKLDEKRKLKELEKLSKIQGDNKQDN